MLAHYSRGAIVAKELPRQLAVFGNHGALFGDGRRIRLGASGEQSLALAKDPRVADAAPCNGHAVHTGLLQHPNAILGAEQVAAAQHDAIAGILLELTQEFPLARSFVALLDGSPVDRDGRHADLEGAVENLEEPPLRLGAVVHAAAHLDRDRHAIRDRAIHVANNGQRFVGMAQHVSATAAAQHFLHWATEIDIHDVVSRPNHDVRCLGEDVWIAAHQLAADRVHVVGHRQIALVLFAGIHDEFVEHDLIEGEAAPQALGDRAHGQIAVARQRRLHERRTDFD